MSETKPQWEQTEEQTVTPKQAVAARQLLVRLRGVLEGMVERDKQKLRLAKEHLHRMKHGGGA